MVNHLRREFLRASVCGAAVLVAGCGSNDSDEGETETPSPSPTPSPASQKTPEEVTENAAPGEVVWKLPADQSINFGHDRVYRGERIQAWTESRPARFEIAALNRQTGRTVWRTRFSVDSERNLRGCDISDLTPVSKNRVVVETATSTFEYAEDVLIHGVTPEGKQWQYPSSPQGPILRSESSNARVLLLSVSTAEVDRFVGIDSETGTERWHIERKERDKSLALIDGAGYIYGPGVVRQVDPGTGEIRWEWVSPTYDGDSWSDLIAGSELVYIHTGDGRITAVSRRTGDVRWTYEAPPEESRIEARIAGDTVYVVAYDDHEASTRTALLSLDRFDGTERWRVDLNEHFGYRTIGNLTWQVMGETVLVRPDNRLLQALDVTDGSTRWSTGSNGTVQSFSTPVSGTWFNSTGKLSDSPEDESTDRVFLTRSNNIEALDAESGERVWEFTDLADRNEAFAILCVDPSARWLLIRERERTTSPRVVTLTRVDGRTGEPDWQFTQRRAELITGHATPEIVFIREQQTRAEEVLALKNGR